MSHPLCSVQSGVNARELGSVGPLPAAIVSTLLTLKRSEQRVLVQLLNCRDHATGIARLVRVRVGAIAGLPRSTASAALRALIRLGHVHERGVGPDGVDLFAVLPGFLFDPGGLKTDGIASGLPDRLETWPPDHASKGNARECIHTGNTYSRFWSSARNGTARSEIERVGGVRAAMLALGAFGRLLKAVEEMQPAVGADELAVVLEGVANDERARKPVWAVVARLAEARGLDGIPGFAASKDAARLRAVIAKRRGHGGTP